jgi:ribokinase
VSEAGGRTPVIGVVGNLTTDLILRGLVSIPRWGHEVLATGRDSAVAGQGGNLALALAHLGLGVDLVSAVGDDDAGLGIVAVLRRAGVGTERIEVRRGERTALSVALVRDDGERAFVSDLGLSRSVDWQRVSRLASADELRVLGLVGLFNLPGFDPEEARVALAHARALGVTTVLDTGWDPGGWSKRTRTAITDLLTEVDVFLPNLDEAEILTASRDAERAAARLAERGPTTVVVKCGAAGCYGLDGGWAGGVPSLPTSVQDAVGAGDSFNAGFLAARLGGLDLRESMLQGNALASIYIGRARGRFANAAELAEVVGKHSGSAATLGAPGGVPST